MNAHPSIPAGQWRRELAAAAQRSREEVRSLGEAVKAGILDAPPIRDGQREPRRMSVDLLTRATPMLFASGTLQPVPASRITHDRIDDSVSVECACEALPHSLAAGASVACNCGRIFINIGRGEVRGCRVPEEDLADA